MVESCSEPAVFRSERHARFVSAGGLRAFTFQQLLLAGFIVPMLASAVQMLRAKRTAEAMADEAAAAPHRVVVDGSDDGFNGLIAGNAGRRRGFWWFSPMFVYSSMLQAVETSLSDCDAVVCGIDTSGHATVGT